MNSAPEHDLIDLIYEAGAAPSLWPQLLTALAEVGEAAGAVLFTYRGGHAAWLSSPGFAPFVAAHMQTHWPLDALRPTRLLAAAHSGFLTDADIFTPQELATEPLFVAHLRPHGFGCGLATAIEVPGGDVLILHLERRLSRGPFEPEIVARLDALRPHLARAAMLTARLGIEHAGAATEALAMIGLPAAVLSDNAVVLRENTLFQPLRPTTLRDMNGRLRLIERGANEAFMAAFEIAARAHAARSIPLPRTKSRPPMVLHLLPLHRAGQEVFEGGAWVLVVTMVVAREAPDAAMLAVLFDLTPAEARVARLLGGGLVVEEVAERLDLARETVRSHVKSILGKLGLRRQADLLRLLSGVLP